MKRIACFLLVTIFMMCWMAFPGSAAEHKQEIIQFEDGSYAIVEVTTTGARAAKSVNGSKQYTYCDSDGVAQWKAVLLIRSAMRWVVSCPALFSRVALLVRRARITPMKSARIRTIGKPSGKRHLHAKQKSPDKIVSTEQRFYQGFFSS